MKLRKIIRYVLFGIFLTALSATFWSAEIRVFKFDRLQGSFEQKYISDLNFQNWFSGDYQKSVDEYFVLNNHLSPLFIKINNQLNYSLFTKLSVNQGILGKDLYLFHEIYINTYYGRDYIGEEKIIEYVQKMKFIQDTLQKLNKHFIYIQAPGKASYFSEYIPDSLKNGSTTETNYMVLSNWLKKYNVNHIDFVPYFFNKKSTTPYPFFTQTGIHWSRYAMALAMDSINKLVEKQKTIDLPNIYWNHVESGIAKDEDKDLETILNMLFPMSYKKYGYPELQYESHKGKDVPRFLMIGDSYIGNLYHGHFYESYDSSSQFWFYNTSVFSSKWSEKIHKHQLNQIDEVNKSDIIILGCTEHNIAGRSWDFVDKFYNYYKYGIEKSEAEINFMKRLESCKTDIVRDNKYQGDIKNIAEKLKISLDSAKTIRCLWLVESKK